jgi:hypothetical protein
MARAYTLVRVAANGAETVISTISTVGRVESQLQSDRASALSSAHVLKAQNPTLRYRIYGPTDTNAARTLDDCVWDSDVNE